MTGKINFIAGKTVEITISGPVKLKTGQEIEIKIRRNKRSVNANSLYWLFCDYVGNALNMTAEEVHEGFKEAHLREFKAVGEKLWRTVKSSAGLDSVEFSEYFEKCQATAAEFGVDAGPFWVQYEELRK